MRVARVVSGEVEYVVEVSVGFQKNRIHMTRSD